MNSKNTMSFSSLDAGFRSSIEKFSNNTALEISGQVLSYQQLYLLACVLANCLKPHLAEQSYIGILSSRSLSGFQGVLASVFNGLPYLPFDLKSNPERVQEIILSTQCKVFILDEQALPLLMGIESQLPPSIFLFPQLSKNFASSFSKKHQALYAEDILKSSNVFVHQEIAAETLAYVLFTSGSTGKPKGVPISNKNICAYIKAMHSLYPLTEQDRCTQAFDFTFDPSVHDMFMTWFSGSCLCVMDEKSRLGAQYFIKKNNITVWNTLPSIVKLCLQMRSFNHEYLSNLKYIFFNGEPLYESVVSALQERVDNTKLINMYGLTETTVNLFHYCWEQTHSSAICRNGIVPIGRVFPEIKMHLMQIDNEESDKKSMELCLSGNQIFSGYLPLTEADSLKNKNIFFELKSSEGVNQLFMRTGDLVLKDDDGVMHIVGRNDEQVKISGHRVDLNIVRYTLEQVTGSHDALVLKKEDPQGAVKLIGFLKGDEYSNVAQIHAEMARRLPAHMLLAKIYVVEDYPYLVSGKVNKRELLARYCVSD